MADIKKAEAKAAVMRLEAEAQLFKEIKRAEGGSSADVSPRPPLCYAQMTTLAFSDVKCIRL